METRGILNRIYQFRVVQLVLFLALGILLMLVMPVISRFNYMAWPESLRPQEFKVVISIDKNNGAKV